ncbi:CIC11C00000002152 [Sungouiella intermedia]|uniref:CIC11C00000002152 n=1 Tax=Sungouiella intermedia TaxID=45354 RepID=A0A1L0BRF4_9ASCO|nr:CIC11C00000002152 [[Candida] intermedia]
MEALSKLREAVTTGKPLNLVIVSDSETTTESVKDATHVKFGDDAKLYSLDEVTNFYNEDVAQPLRAVIFCWLHDKSSIVDYKNACLENGILDFKFLVKAELTTWLNGSSDTCQFIKDDKKTNEKANGSASLGEAAKKRKFDDPQLDRISELEIDSVDHNAALRGTKNVNLKNLISDAKRFSSQLKKSKSSKSALVGAHKAAKKQPIIIISPATTALLSLSNIKEFLEEGRFVEPSMKRSDNGVVIVNHESEKLIPTAQSIMVVDNVDLFTKPEYWDRVVAVFTTGHAWQFAKYKYSKPEILFQKYPGFFVSYHGDVIPKQISDWNVSVVQVDRGEKRFRDKMIVRDLWIQLEKILVARNYGTE